MTIPSDTHVPGDSGHVNDHNNIADVLTSLSSSVAGSLPLAGGTMTGALAVTGSSATQLVYIEQDASTGHGLTVNLVGTGGATQAAINIVSANSAFSAAEISGTETAHGTLKLTHLGYSNASDGGAAALSIDLQTTVGGSTGTGAQGIFITSTTDAAPGGNALTVRYNSLDQFVLKSSGLVGIGVAIGHTPAGMIEIAQKDTSTVGLFMQAIASGTDLVSLKDSSGTQRFQINNAGNAIHRANSFFSTAVQVGSVSGDFGGGSSCISIKHATDPTTNPTGGAIIYVDSSGNLLCRTSAGNVRTIAAV